MAYENNKFRTNTDEAVYESGNNCTVYLYRNSQTKEYEAYVSRLLANGYSLLQKNENYNFHFCALTKETEQINILFTPCDQTVRIAVDLQRTSIPLLQTSCCARGETAFYAFENDHTLIDCGMCLLVQCPDNSFFVVDSGHYFQMNDNDRLHSFMRERTPAGEKIVINGWLVTHTHSDHISKLSDFLKYNCDDVVIEGFYMNFLSENYVSEDWGREENEMGLRFRQQLAQLKNIPKHKIHTGQRLYIRNLVLDVLCTQEDIHPQKIEDFNDSSVVVMLAAENTKIFIPGDASEKCSEILEQRFGDKLKCDIVQISHHGHSGLSEKVYEYLHADIAVFPVTRIKFAEELPRLAANRTAIALAKEYYITSDGTVKISLPYNEKSISVYPDEAIEDFRKIERLWGYTYTPEYRKELYDLFLQNGGKPENTLLPVCCDGTFLD